MSNPFSPDLESQHNHRQQGALPQHPGSAKPSRHQSATPKSGRSSYSDYGDRIPPQKLVSSGQRPSAGSQTSESAPLVPPEAGLVSAAPPARRYVVYGDTDDEAEDIYHPSGRRGPKRSRLVNFWASILSICLSLPMVGYSVYLLVHSTVSSPVTLSCTIAIVLGSISLLIEILHSLPAICPKFLHWQLGRHAMLHCLIACFSILPYMQHQNILGLLLVSHIIPACLFYTARARRESIPAKL